ncbi:AraC family transcriptional regulator [Erythrobacter litoralis]|uniref:Putative transcriptional regulator n=1 Tax=Erythrobacter litoralis (strain HTCC2594) TaxID=314225 RepID=Q2N634_ERYLH|nr:helix-turn-helix domain-containing protein [Erythrobacter litoralis]ABC64857.1 putative transcriptional regulator [Erythrobacter litoralis HTCC2594]
MISRPALDLRVFAVPDHLAELVTTIYRLDVDLPEGETVSDWLLPEWGNMRFLANQVEAVGEIAGMPLAGQKFTATGPSNAACKFVVGKVRIFGFGLLPLGWANYIRRPASELTNSAFDGMEHPAFATFAKLADALQFATPDDMRQFRILTDFLTHHAEPPRDHERIRLVQEAMTDPYLVQIPDFAERAGVTVRTLERLCLRSFGFSPNVILRRQRLVRSLASFMNDGGARWSEAIDRHYHDQPHFVREFHHFMGMSPSEYADQDHPIMRAFMENRREVWGVPARVSD